MQSRSPQFQTLGAVRPGRGIYVERAADALIGRPDTYQRVRYMLCPTQVGKTSYINRAMTSLRSQGARCALLNCLDSQFEDNPEQVFGGFIASLADELELGDGTQLAIRYLSRSKESQDALRDFLVHEVATHGTSPVYIFVDELNAFLTNSLWPKLLAALAEARRELRTSAKQTFFHLAGIDLQGKFEPAFHSLFPNDFEPLELTDFSRSETDAFLPVLSLVHSDSVARHILDRLHEQISGHPAWTQKLLKDLCDDPPKGTKGQIRSAVDKAVATLRSDGFSGPVLSHLENYIRVGLKDPSVCKTLSTALSVYVQLHRAPTAVRSRHELSQEVRLLTNLGLVRVEPSPEGVLLCQVRNEIVGEKFSPDHIKQLTAAAS